MVIIKGTGIQEYSDHTNNKLEISLDHNVSVQKNILD